MFQNLHELVTELIDDTKGSSVRAFAPELVLCVTIVLMLLLRLFNWFRRLDMMWVALLGSSVALALAAPWKHLLPGSTETIVRTEIFTGMLVYDTFSVYVRSVLLLFVVLFTIFSKLSGIPDRDDSPDIFALVLGATLGMCLMASANHLLMVFMAVEMASVPSYVLAGMLKGKRLGSEAALKYSVYGAGAAGIMLYGISLLAGLLNTAHMPTLASQLAAQFSEMTPTEHFVLALGGSMIMVGLAFKLSAVPFHFWCPDVFEGATAEVNAFLSVASKAAALALLVRVAIGFGTLQNSDAHVKNVASPSHSSASTAAAGPPSIHLTAHLAEEAAASEPKPNETGSHDDLDSQAHSAESAMRSLAPVRSFIGKMVALLAIITCTFGNLAAYGQTNIKRLMAYSTIAHAGYMMMPVPVIMEMADVDSEVARGAVAALCIYIGIYLFMNLGGFAVIAFLRNAMRTEEIADYAGLIRRCPAIVICFAIIMFSLIGLPPLAGFVGKFAIFASLADGYRVGLAAGHGVTYLLILLLVGSINTAISLFYYLRVVKVMTLDPEPADRVPFDLPDVLQRTYVVFCAAAVVFLFFSWEPLSIMARAAARSVL